mgnify:CR=1 FL=1
MKKRRHAKILELINSHDIETQEELKLHRLQYPVTLKNSALLKIYRKKADMFILPVKRIITKTQGEQAEYLANQS